MYIAVINERVTRQNEEMLRNIGRGRELDCDRLSSVASRLGPTVTRSQNDAMW